MAASYDHAANFYVVCCILILVCDSMHMCVTCLISEMPAMQGQHHLGLEVPQMRQLFAEVANLAAQNSLIVGELPAMSRSAAADMLAEAGMLSRVLCGQEACEELGISSERHLNLPEHNAEVQRWLFTAQHKHLSNEEMGILGGHTQAAEETDEDFFDNIS